MKDVIKEFWRLFNERKFEAAKELLHKDFVGNWKATGEIFENRTTFIEVNSVYPGNWKADLTKLETTETGVVSVTYLYFEDTADKYFATTFYEFQDGLISKIEEYWATCEDAPEWRAKYAETENES